MKNILTSELYTVADEKVNIAVAKDLEKKDEEGISIAELLENQPDSPDGKKE